MPDRCRPMLVALACLLVTGCAATGEKDPYENWNRKVYAVNDAIDRATLKPVAKGYRAVTPRFVRSGVSNVFANLVTPRSSLNNLLQGKPGRSASELGRFVLNSTLGLAGLMDVGSALGIQAYPESFGETFSVWGIGDGPYVYLPILGPNTMSDVIAQPFDFGTDLVNWIDNTGARDRLRVMKIVDIRTGLLSAENIIADSEDPYVALREAYLQNREYRVYDGNPPASEEEDALFDEFLEELDE